MGGKKKLTLKQMERAAEKKDETSKKGSKAAAVSTSERRAPGITLPDLRSDKIIGEVRKMKAVTPYTVASRFNLRLSVARDMLDELAQKGIIEYVSGSKNLKIYKPHD